VEFTEFGDAERYRIEIAPGENGRAPRVLAESLAAEEDLEPLYVAQSASKSSGSADAQGLTVRLRKPKRVRKGTKASLSVRNTKPALGQLAESNEPKGDLGGMLTVQFALGALRSMRFLDLQPEAMRLPSVPGQVVLGDRGENLSSVLQSMCETEKKKQAVLEWIRQLTPLDVEDFEFLSDQTGKILVCLIESGGQRTSAYSASDGTLRFLAMIAAMLGPDPARFYFFEELDTGIHPTRLYLLLQLIEQTVSHQDIQVVATTHSPQLLAFLGNEAREAATLVYRLPHHGEAHLRRILDIPEAKQVLATRNLSRLHESRWLENAVEFIESPQDGAEVAPS
jgi:hypothetical protein